MRTMRSDETSPRPTIDTIGYYYTDDYEPYVNSRVMSQDTTKIAAWKRFLTKGFRFNSTRTPNIPPGRMLEIGCASGNYLHEMAQKGWQVYGIEPSSSAAQNAQELGIVYIMVI